MSSSYNVLVVALHVLFIVATGMSTSEATPSSPPLSLSPASPPPPSQNKTLTFYLQKILADGTNAAVANTVPVAGIKGKLFGLQQFGTFYVYDVNMTASPSRNSTLIGQEYGTFAIANLKGYVFMVSSTYVFTSGELAGSTLTGLGVFDMKRPVSYIPIVGGTNALANAIGYIAYQIVVLEPPYMVIKVTPNYKIAA